MKHILLSSFGSADWVPLLFPLVAIVIIYYCVDYGIKFFKKWKLNRKNKLGGDNIPENSNEEQQGFEH